MRRADSRQVTDPLKNPGCLLTPLQQASVARSLLSPAGGHYIQQLVCDWAEPLRIDAWQRAWDFVAGRHDTLRACFRWHEIGEPAQHFADSITAPMEIVRAGPAAAERARVVSDFLGADRKRGFNLARAPLWRLTVFCWNDREATTVWTFHHSLLDGRSHAQVWREVDAAYRAFLAGTVPEFPPARPFREFVAWLATASVEAAAAYWRERLREFHEATDLPTLSSAPDSGADDGPPAMESVVLDPAATAKVREAAERHGVTLNNLVQGAWALALARYQSVEEIVFGVTRSGRHWTEDEPNTRVGMFINTVPFRVDASPVRPVGAWVRGLRAQQLATRVGEHASADQIRHWCGLPRSAALIRTAVMFENRDPAELFASPTQRFRLVEKTDLPTLAAYAGTVLTLTLDYSPRRHPAAQARTVIRHLHALLEAFAEAPGDRLLGDLPMLSPEDRQLLFEAWQGPSTPHLAPAIHRVLEAQAARTPSAPAVEFLAQSITCAELHRRANQLARRLLQFCSPGDRVAVVLDRAFEQPIAWLAALKASLVYAPVDPSNPRDRLEFYFEDLRPAVLLTQTALLPHLPVGTLRVLCVDSAAERAAQATLDTGHLSFEPPPDAPANLLYTSGSTGLPKAAINSRGGLDNFAIELRRTFDIGPDDRVLQSSATSFDASLFDFIAALQAGATLVLVPSEQLRPGAELSRLLVDLRISVVLLTPTVMRSTPVPAPPAVRVLISAGEPLTADLLERWAPGRRVFNVCGPTECSIWFTCEESRADGDRPTIGRLITNCRGYVLDDTRQPQPVGVPGELYFGGTGVGLGYRNRLELTAERYLPDPFAGTPGAHMYRTGDRARWLADGRIDYLGRLDSQVKVQGVRVELGEIEAALRRHPAVADAAVVLHNDRLLAWLVARDQAPSAAALRAWLADHIPLIFTPAEFHTVPEFPRTRTGKVDRTALRTAWLAARSTPVHRPAPKPTAAERQKIIEDWNRTVRAFPLDRTVVEFFREQVRQRPEAPALKAGPKVVSYAALNLQANRIAQRLLRAGLKPEDIVALRFDRSIAWAACALGVLKAGGAYLPLDVNVPPARQEFVLSDSGARFALVAPEFLGTLAGWPGWAAAVDGDATASDGGTDTDPVVPDNPRHRAYVIYTSGSTGQPKGVEIEHRSLTNLVCFYHERLQLTPADRTTLLANTAFDASVADLWPALCAGGTVLVPVPGLLGDPDGLIAWLADEGATFSFVPTALGELMLGRPWPSPLALRFLCVGGETLRVRPPPGFPFSVLNSYGPTENTVDATWEVVSSDEAGVPSRPGIGRPIANVRAYVLDEELEPVAAGVEGELFLGGVQVARGYLNRLELTRERFLADPFAGTPAARMYRTGDRARWRADGSLEFLGRTDDQVQIRGQRVELGEIEATLRQHPGVREACCRPLADREAANRASATDAVGGVVAHVVMPDISDGELVTDLRRFLEARLPGYMVPAIFVRHPALPLTPQGKVDRIALDATVHAETAHGATIGIPTPDHGLDPALTELWRRVLPGCASARADQTFQELGGDSLRAVKLLLGVEKITSRRLALSTFLLEPTLAGLCRVTTAAEAKVGTASVSPISRRTETGNVPLSFAQERLWFLDQLAPNNSLYNMPIGLRLGGELGVAALQRCLDELIRRHEVLRTRFQVVEGRPVQVIEPFNCLDLPLVDVSHLPEPDRNAATIRLCTEEARRPFNLASDLMLRARLFRLRPQEHVLFLNMNHIASDGWSVDVLVRELSDLYRAFSEGRPSPLNELSIQYADFAVWQRGWLQGERLEKQIHYWKNQLAGAAVLLELPADRPRPARQSYRGAHLSRELSKSLSVALAKLSRQEEVTLFMTLLAAFQTLLHRYTSRDDILVGSPVSGRNSSAIEGLVGFFVNTLVLRGDFSGNPSFRSVLRRTREVCLAAYTHQDLPFTTLVEELRPERDLSHSPLFQVMFTVQNAPTEAANLARLRATPIQITTGTSKFDLTLTIQEHAEGLKVAAEYSMDLFDEGTIDRMLGHYQTLLEAIANNPDEAVGKLQILRPAERHQVLVEWNRTDREYPRDKSIPDLFEAQVQRSPGAVAVVEGNQSISYRALNEEANRLAHFLQQSGIGRNACVGVMMPRSIEYVAAVLGILKAGAAYVPLEMELPAERLRFGLRNTMPRLVLHRGGEFEKETLGDQVRLLGWDALTAAASGLSRINPGRLQEATDLAYVMHTSGSTGEPKGVAVPHRAVVRLVFANDFLPFDDHQTYLMLAPTAFDASTLELWGALLHGSRLVVYPVGPVEVNELQSSIEKHRVTCLWLTSALFNAIINHTPQALAGVRNLIIGGEILSVKHVRQALESLPATQITNGYGPTEGTTFTTTFAIPRELAPDAVSIPIGRPIANTRVYILDSHLQPVPVGVVGELYIGGDGLARGYLNQPELTARTFIDDPFNPEFGARLYRTGDLVRHRFDGNIEFLGRSDNQVKVRGFRIELEEVEAILSTHPLARECAVVARDDVTEGKCLVAYIVGREEKEASSDLRSFLAQRLPHYMLPGLFVFLEKLPLSPSGKLDRKALPTPRAEALRNDSDYSKPENEVESRLAKIWGEVLGRDSVGTRDNFFELGGHSLLAVRLQARVEKDLGVRLPLTAFFQAPTVAEFARLLGNAGASASSLHVLLSKSTGNKPPLFCLHFLSSARNLAKHLGTDRAVYGIESPIDEALRQWHQHGQVEVSVENLAACHMATIRRVQLHGPYHLAGFCFGGVLAFEVACQFTRQGDEVALLALLDASYGPGCRPVSMPWVRRLAYHASRAFKDGAGYLLWKFRKRLRVGERRQDKLEHGVTLPQAGFLMEVLKPYRGNPYDGGAVLFRTTAEPVSFAWDPGKTNGWQEIVRGELHVEDIHCNHAEISAEPYVSELARKLEKHLARTDAEINANARSNIR